MTCDPATGVPRAAWRFILLADFASLTGLRRHLGRARTALLARDVAARAHAVLPEGLLQPSGRHLLEIDAMGSDPDDLRRMAERLAAAFDAPVDVDGERHRIDLAIGASFGPIGGVEEVLLLEAAEDALSQAQLERRAVVRDAEDGSAADRLTLGRDLAGAAERGELFLQYQPKLHVRRQQVTSVEALMRWNHPGRGLVLPGDFIPLAETTQAIGPMTLWALERAIADYHVLRRDGHDITVFINIAGQLLGDIPFIDEACRLVTGGGARIGFEITETSVIRDPDLAIEHLKRIADQGVPIAIDDYGAGLSSLAYLKKLPATELKIDKMFVMELTSSHRDPLIVRSTIDLAHAMEMEVTAEGVETPAALALLSVMGCDLVQGFLLSRPIGLEALRHYLTHDVRKNNIAPAPGFDLRKRA